MTLNGAIMQLVEMRENSMMPELFRPFFDKVIETIISECSERLPSAQHTDYSDGYADGYKQGLKDAQPIRHGHWLRSGRMNVYGGFEVECSVCNDSVMITNTEYEHYCRNCGARMDEEEVSE